MQLGENKCELQDNSNGGNVPPTPQEGHEAPPHGLCAKMNKVVLAYSGGSDTVIVPWLRYALCLYKHIVHESHQSISSTIEYSKTKNTCVPDYFACFLLCAAYLLPSTKFIGISRHYLALSLMLVDSYCIFGFTPFLKQLQT